MKKRNMGPFIAMGGIALVLIIASIFLIVSSSYTARLVLVNDGFFVGEQVHDCLYANDESAVVTSIPAIGASQSDILYEKSGKYFLGDDYTPVSLNFPYVINNASAVMFTSSVDKLITGTFEYVDSYENLYMSGGVTFNADMERAYREDFILVDAGNGIYMNADKLTVGGALTTSGEIPANSFIRFMENEIGYYYYDNDALIYARIAPVSRTATISLGGYSYTYIEFLEKLGLYTERKAKDKTTPTPTPLPNEEDDEVEPAGEREVFVFGDSDADEGNDNEDNNGDADRQSSATGSGRAEETGDTEETEITDESERDDDEEREMITPDPGERPTRAPRPTRVPSQPEPAEEPLPAEDQGTRVTPTPRPTATPLPTPTLIPALEKTALGEDPVAPAAPAAAAPAAAALPKPAPPAPVRVSTGSAVRPIIFDEWKMPEVTVGEITTGVFTIFLDNFHIDHVKYIDPRSGVMFNVKEADTDKLALAKSVMSGGPVRLSAPFKPETKYTIEIILHYLNEFGEAKEKKVLEYGTVYTTLDRSKLDTLDLKAEKGQREPDFFHLLNLHIGIAYENAQLETPRYIESLEFLGRVEIEAINKNDDKDVRKFTLGSSDLRNLRNGVINPDYKSAKVFRSNSEYEYTIRATDRTGGSLLFELADGTKTTEYKGSFKTCSEIPKASFTVRNNRIFDYTVAVRISNPGNAQLKNNVKFRVCDISDPDIEDAVVQTTVQYLNTTAGGTPVFDDEETDTEHEFPAVLLDGLYDPTAVQGAAEQFVEILIKFTDLSAQSIYRLDVYGDCDIYRVDREECESDEDYENKRWSHEIFGSNKFTTASLASLGNLFLDNRIPAENENLEEGTLYMTLSIGERTDDLLVKLLDRIELGLSYNKKDENGEETGEYIKDTDAKISFAIVDRESTDLVDATSVVSHERPENLGEYENEAVRRAQIAYNNIINNTERYNELLGGLEKTAGKDAEAQYDEDGNPLTYSAYKEKFNDANAAISTGNYGEDTPEYEQYQADIAAFEDLVKTLENEANALLRQEAEDERERVRLVEYKDLLAGRSQGYTTENLFFKTEVEEGQYQVDLNKLRRRVSESESASGSAITYKYAKELRIAITGLKTDTMYRIDAEGYATTNMKTDRIARTLLTMSTFRTYKKKAIVSMDAYYAGANFISFFGLKIVDPDGAISEYPVEMVLTDSLGQIMGSRTFKGPDQSFEEVRFGSLTTNEWHYLTFKATGYNKGWTKSSAEINREIFVNDNTETLKVITRESIKANISLLGINDAYDLADEVRVFVDSAKTNIKTLQGRTTATGNNFANIAISNLTFQTKTNGKQYASNGGYLEARYKVEVNLGDDEYNIIEPCIRPIYNKYTRYEVYSNSEYTDLISVVDKNAEVRVSYGSGSATALNRGYWTSNYIRLTRKLTGNTTLYIKAVAINGVTSGDSKGVYPLVGFSFHKFGENAYTANINAVIEDEFGQLSNGSISSYIIRVYEKEGEATSEDLGYTLISERVHAWNEIDNYSGVGDNCNLKMYTREQWDETSGKGTPDLGEKTFYGTANTINTDFGILVNKDKYYRMELWVMINNYSIRLGTSGFTSDRMIHSIENEDDLIDAYCHPSDSYIVMNDITTSKTNIYTTTQFDGVIDFNGHKLTHLAGSYLIYSLGAYGELRNIVYEKGNGGNHNYVNMMGLLYYNYGLVNGIQVIYNNGLSDKILKSSSYVDGLIAYQNYPTGIIENFSIELKKDIWFYGADGVSLAVWLNYGKLRNGYCCATAVEGEEYENGNPTVYANDITVDQNGGYPAIYMLVKLDDIKKVITNEVTAKTTYTQNYITGGLCRINRDGIIENVFTNIDIYARSNDTKNRHKRAASICGRNEGFVRNSFSASRVYYYKEDVTPRVFAAKNGWSPACLNYVNGTYTYGHSTNVYHYDMGLGYGLCKDTEGYSIDSRDISKELLYDHNWYEVLFNESGSTSPNQWDYEMLTRSCFPHVVMSENMPDQPMVKLPALSQSSTEISVLAANVYQQEDTSALATITFYNPNGFLVRDITIDYLKTTIITQWNEGKFYYVRVELSDPVKFYTGYKLTGFTFSNRNGSGRQTGNMHEKTVDVNAEFFGLIYTIQDFRNMSDGLDQNYKLGRDIDFSGYDAKDYALGYRKTNGDLDTVYKNDDNKYCFTGQFEGNNKTLRNIDVGNTGFLFGKVAGPIRNLYIENIHTPSTEAYGAQKSTATYMGVVAVLRLGGSIDNVHVRGAKFENITQYGGVLLARNFYENEIKNCSVQDAVLTTGMPVENATAASVGGICGHNDLGLQIHNCFVDGITIMAEQAGDVYGVGGLVGYTVQGIEIENVYVVHGRIETNFSNVGGLIGSVQSMNDVNNTSKETLYTGEYFISNFYEDVEIITMANNVGGVIGYTSKVSGTDWAYGVNFGAIVSKSNGVDVKTLNPIVGFYTSATAADYDKGLSGKRFGKHNYIYSSYQMDGEDYITTLRFNADTAQETEEKRESHFKSIDYATLTSADSYGYKDALIRPILGWRDNFIIDQDDLSKGIMPKLYYTDDVTDIYGNRIELPGQKGFSLQKDEVEVTYAHYLDGYNGGQTDNGDTEFVPEVLIKIDHDEGINITGAGFEGCVWGKDEQQQDMITILKKSATQTEIRGSLKIFENFGGESIPYAKDKFFLTKIYYDRPVVSGGAIVAGSYEHKVKDVYRDIGLKSRWVTIRTVSDWNRFMSQDGSEGAYGDRGFNVKLAPENGVLDFGNNVNMAASRVKINHLIGMKNGNDCGIDLNTMTGTYSADCAVTIRRLFLYDDELSTGNSNCLIEQATGKIYGINFENCTVSQTYKGAVAGGKVSNKTNIIGVVNGDIDHVSFKNVDILAFKSANIAPIGLAYGVSTNIKLEDVNIVQMRTNGTYISNYSNRAGYVAFLGKFAGVNGVTAKRVYVDAAGSYLGGVVGKQVGGCYLWDISGEDIAVISRSNSSYNGGLVGAAFDRGTMQRVAKLHVDRVFVIGGAYSGGLMGRGYIGGWDGDGYRYVNSSGNSKRLGLSISLGKETPEIQNDLDDGTTVDSIRSWVKNGMIMAWHNGTNQTTSGAGWDFIGGAVGLGGVWKTDVENTWVFGDDYTGGVVGGYSVVDSKATNVFVSNISEKIEGERLGRYDDPWPSIFYRVGSDDPNATDYYRKLLDDRFGGKSGSNYMKLADDVGKEYTWVRDYVRGVTGKDHSSSANRIFNHDYEQNHANGEFFNWKRGRILDLCDDTDDTFWNEVTWGMTSYNGGNVSNFGFDEWDYGRAGKTMNKLSTMMQSSSQDVVKNDAKNDAKGKINRYKTSTAINDGIVSEMISRFNQYNVHYPEEPATLSYIGGISGYNLGMRSVAAENCVIYAPRDFYVGGITGRSTGGHDSGYSTAYGIQSAMVKNCTVIGGSKVGGAVGEIWRDNYQYIEVDGDTYVEARMFGTTAKLAGQTYTSSSVARNNKTSSTGEMAGGIAGRVYMGSSTANEQAQMKYILSAATVVARKNAGGIVGAYDQGFYTNKTDVGWMMLGQVVVWDGDGSTGKLVVKPNVSGKTNSYKTGAVHQNSELRYTIGGSKPEDVPVNTKDYSPGVTGKISKVTSLKQSAQQYYDLTNEKEEGYPILKLVTRSDLANGSTYTGIEWPARVEITSAQITAKTYTYAQFLEKRIKYDKLSDGKLPYYTLAGSIQYENTANNIRCANETMFKENPMYLYIPDVQKDSASGSINAAGSETDLSGIPKATIYSSSVDTVSIDFSRIDPNYTWSLSLGGVVKSGVVDRRTISFTFDYKDEVTLFVEGVDGGTVYTSSGADLANYVSAVGGSYCYITGDGIVRGSGSSSLPTRYGDFVNLFGGKALERDGSIIDIETGAATAANERGTSQGDDRTPAPLAGGEFGGYRIETYATYSVTENLSTGEQAVRDEFLFYTDGKSLQSIRSDEGVKAGNVILWSDLDNTYFASLGTDRKLTVLLDGAFKVPEGISTEGIYQMSNSNDIRVPYCIVRYAGGGLCAFNFVTGEILLNLEAPQGTAGGGGDAVSNNSAISFSLAKELINSINSGAVDLNGIVASPADRGLGAVSAIVDGEYVDGSVLGGEPGGTVTDPGIAVDGLATAVGTEAADGEFIGNIDEALGNPENSEPGEQQEVDENVVDGDLIPEGTEIGTGSSGEAQTGQIESTNGSDTPTEAGGSGEESAVQTGNTISGTSGSSSEDAGAYTVEGELSAPTNGEGNGNTGSLVTLAGSTSTVSADVESSIEELIEDGSLSVEQIVADIGISETEVIKALAEAAQKKYDMIPSISADDAVREAYKAILRGEEGITVKTDEQLELNTRSDNEAIASELGIIDLTGNPAENTVDPSTMQFVPVYNPETGEYELFEMDELLSGSNPEDKSIEERLKKNGMFLNTAHGFSTGESESKTTHDYKGFIAVIIAILLAGGLSGAMIYKKRKEGKG